MADTAARLAYISLRGCSAHSGLDPCLQGRGRRSWCKEDIEESLRSVENQEEDLVCAHHLLDASYVFAELLDSAPDGTTIPR